LFTHTSTEPAQSNQNYSTSTLIAPRAFTSFLFFSRSFRLTQFVFRSVSLSRFPSKFFVWLPQGPIMLSQSLKFPRLKLLFHSSSNLYKLPRLFSPFSFSSKFLISTSVPVLTLPDFQTPNDPSPSMTSEVPASPQPPEIRPRIPPCLSFDARKSHPQKRRHVKPRPKEKPSVTDVEAAWSTGIYPYSLVNHAASSKQEHIQSQSLRHWYG